MNGFITQLAECLYRQYGDDVSSLVVMFPSRRARLFFNDALSTVADKPLWQPSFTTVDEVISEISTYIPIDRMRAVTELYKVYSQYHDENFDSFYFWGEMLLTDFDSIDKYLIDADMLFSNLADLRDIESDLSYLSPEQAEIVARFWKSVGGGAGFSTEKQKFIDIWNTLAAVYHQFKEVLAGQGLAYPGMMYRDAAEKIKAGQVDEGISKRFIIAGFNALSECEKILFDYLSKQHTVDFFWDYDHYYLNNTEQEAGLFLRDNIRRFPQKMTLSDSYDNFSFDKNITIISAPSDSLQCKYVADFIDSIRQNGVMPGKETAIVLTDENLLIPLLHSIPEDITNINVTMGYPLMATPAYTFVERLIELQARKRSRAGRISFYHSDVNGLLRHPFLSGIDGCEAAMSLYEDIISKQLIYIDSSRFRDYGDFLSEIFTPVSHWPTLAEYLVNIISRVASEPVMGDSGRERIEFLTVLTDNILQVTNSLNNCGVELSVKIFASLLRKVLQGVRMPYQGEPLSGIQIMGILETRTLDFENVLMLSMNDDSFPGNRAASSSFIPHNMRLAYGLPTPQHHEGVYAYYFYRLLQRTQNAHLVYSSKSDEKSSGEQSRYIYQLEYESDHTLNRHTMGLDVSLGATEPIVVAKEGEVWDRLQVFLYDTASDDEDDEPVKLSPTAFFNYVACPLKFYFYSVARLSTEDEVTEEVDAPMFGSILHRAMQLLYKPLTGRENPQNEIRTMIGTEVVKSAVSQAVRDEYFHGENTPEQEYGGNLLFISDIVIKYINTCLLPYDASVEGYTIFRLEESLRSDVNIDVDGAKRRLLLGGKADRLDVLADKSMRIVDYKTGAEHLEFKGVDLLFSVDTASQNAAVLQTMMYAMMVHQRFGVDVQPVLYYTRKLNEEGHSPLLKDKESGRAVGGYLEYKDVFEEQLKGKLSEIFDKNIPFMQCEDIKQCKLCDFDVICHRQ